MKYINYAIYGNTGSGKTAKCLQIIKENQENFDNILYINVNCDSSIISNDKMYVLSLFYIEDILAFLQNLEPSNSLICIDDFACVDAKEETVNAKMDSLYGALHTANNAFCVKEMVLKEFLKNIITVIKQLQKRGVSFILVNPLEKQIRYMNMETIKLTKDKEM